MRGGPVEADQGSGVFVNGVAVVLDEMLGGGEQEAGGSAGRIAAHVLGRDRIV